MNMVLAVMYREFRIRTRSMTWIFYDLFMPLLYLMLFGLGLDRALSGGIEAAGRTWSYNAFFLPGVLSMACFGIAINTSYGFFVDRDNGIFYELLTYPMTRAEFLIGKILFNCLLSLLQVLLTIAASVSLLGIPVRLEHLGWIMVGAAIGTAGWFFFLTIFALRITRNDLFNAVLNVLYFVLMFASSLFYPLEGMPAWFRVLSLANPLTWHTDVLRLLAVGGTVTAQAYWEGGGFLLFLLLSFLAAVRTLTRGILK